MKQTQKEKKDLRELGWLFLGIIFGGLTSILVDIFSHYYFRFLDTIVGDNWILILLSSATALIVALGLTLLLALKLIGK